MMQKRAVLADLKEKVRSIEPVLRQHTAEAESSRRLSRSAVEAMRGMGLYDMTRPRELGGLELDPVSLFRVLEEVSRIDSAAGWNLAFSNSLNAFPAWLPEQGVAEVMHSKNVILAGAFTFPVAARVSEGGYTLSGRLPYVSGVHESDWIMLQAVVQNEPPRVIMAFFPTREARIIETWDTLGMRGTGSHDMEISELFVPEHRTAAMAPLEKPHRAYQGPLYRLTVWPATASGGPVMLGIAAAAIAAFVELAQAKTPAFSGVPLRSRPTVHRQLAEAAGCLDAGRSLLHTTFEEAWRIVGEGEAITLDMKARMQLAACFATEMSARAVDLVRSIAGMQAILVGHSLERHFRDAHTLTQHAFASQSRLEDVGQIMLGLPPSWPFFSF